MPLKEHFWEAGRNCPGSWRTWLLVGQYPKEASSWDSVLTLEAGELDLAALAEGEEVKERWEERCDMIQRLKHRLAV